MPSAESESEYTATHPDALLKRETSCLYSGARFEGEQRSGRSAYQVAVTLQHVDLSRSYLCGYLNIKGLTEDWPELCTFFEAEVIGNRHSFLTRKWDADEKTDRQHWSKFPNFNTVEPYLKNDAFNYDFMNNDMVFMRWKEHFLVPDHKIKTISGASFAGFYYIAYQKSTESITGFYFHQNSEMFQYLTLKHVGGNGGGGGTEADRGTGVRGSAAFEFC
ncbi:hypothetical protein CcCBS67573_g03314 [Chytriomyces confervae]|uniref:Uncharacterized protein n=1 Tax=Chytriomyces confervae TaxID=246404 RepID=A0A507FIC7_9FUNG|nr:GID complex subunit 4, VID24 [Chytriomyces hyalinus]TPX75395.1 hypothetical protein CcCBS67573_g03314 [Chytriomyces confervae]